MIETFLKILDKRDQIRLTDLVESLQERFVNWIYCVTMGNL